MPLPLLPIIGILAQFAPQITKWLDAGKTIQEVAETASSIAKQVTGTSNTDDAVEALKGNPELVAAYQNKILEQDMDYERLYIKDKESARAMAAALASTPQGAARANALTWFACGVVVLCAVIVVFMTNLDEYAKTTITLVLGMFLNELKNIYSFEFGTTRRSRAKSDAMDITKAE